MARVKPLLLLGLFLIMVAFGYLALNNKENASTGPRKTLAAARFFDRAGKPVSIGDYKGKVVLLNLWATWCVPCVAELPSLDKLQGQFEGQGLQVLPICIDHKFDAASCELFMQDKKVTKLFSWWDRDRVVTGEWRYDGVPTSILLDRGGGIIKVFDGPVFWDQDEGQQAITAALAEK